MNDWLGRDHPIVGGATPGIVILCSIENQAEEARGSKPVSSILFMPSASAPAFRIMKYLSSYSDFFQRWKMLWEYKLNNPFLPNFVMVMCFIITVDKLSMTVRLWAWRYNTLGHRTLRNQDFAVLGMSFKIFNYLFKILREENLLIVLYFCSSCKLQ